MPDVDDFSLKEVNAGMSARYSVLVTGFDGFVGRGVLYLAKRG
jgi:hypothetical protein